MPVTISEDESLFLDTDDPTEGNIKIVGAAVVPISACDADTGWSISGGASTVAYLAGFGVEGTGCLVITIPASTTATLTWNAGPVDLGDCGWCRFWLYKKTSVWGLSYSNHVHAHAHMGESAAYGIDIAAFTMNPGEYEDVWFRKDWNLTAVAHDSKDAITHWQIELANQSSTNVAKIYLDYIYGDSGSATVKAHDGAAVRVLFPKIYASTYEGTTAHQVIYPPRKGTPTFIMTICLDAAEAPHVWMKGFGNSSMQIDGATPTWYATSSGIHNVTDGAFDLYGAAPGCNTNGMTYYYFILYED